MKMNSLMLVIISLTAILSPRPADAFLVLRKGSAPYRWQDANRRPVHFAIDNTPPPGISRSDFAATVRQAFRAWESQAEIDIRFVENMSLASAQEVNRGGQVHLVSVDLNGGSGLFAEAGIVARTPLQTDQFGNISDADIVLNARDYTFSLDGRGGSYDLLNVLTHEVGHFLGLDHSPIRSATMTPEVAPGQTRLRSLSADDIAGAATLYPSSAAKRGSLHGRVRSSNGGPLSGAHVIAHDTRGRVATGTLSANDGSFSLHGLSLQEAYTVEVEPLSDARFAATLARVQDGLRIDADFGATAYGLQAAPSFYVPSSAGLQLGDLRVRPAAKPKPLVLHSISDSVLEPGVSVDVSLSSSGLLPNDIIEIRSSEIGVSQVEISGAFGTFVTLKLAVRAGAAPQVLSVRVLRPSTGDLAVLTGALEIRTPDEGISGSGLTSQPGSTGLQGSGGATGGGGGCSVSRDNRAGFDGLLPLLAILLLALQCRARRA